MPRCHLFALCAALLPTTALADAEPWEWWLDADCGALCPPARMGFNHVRVADSLADGAEVREVDRIAGVAADIAELGGGVARHLEGRDASWWMTYDFEAAGDYSAKGSYRFDGYLNADDGNTTNDGGSERAVRKLTNEGVAPILTLFQMGHTSGARLASDWGDLVRIADPSLASDLDTLSDQISTSGDLMGPHGEVLFDGSNGWESKLLVEGYAAAVAEAHMGDGVRLFEAGNEVYFDAMTDDLGEPDPERFARILHHTRIGLDSVDPDTFLMLGGLADFSTRRFDGPVFGLPFTDYDTVDDWLVPVIEAEQKMFGETSINAVGFHYYGLWQDFSDEIERVQVAMDALGIGEMPLWLTEVGCPQDDDYWEPCTSDEKVQAAEVVRLFSLAFGNGVDMALWHTHLSKGGDCEASQWNCYGLLEYDGTPKRSWYTYQLLSERVGNFGNANILSEGDDDAWVVTFGGALDPTVETMERKWIVWTEREDESVYDLTAVADAWDENCLAEVTNMVPKSDGIFTTFYSFADELGISPEPYLVEPVCREDDAHAYCWTLAEVMTNQARTEGECSVTPGTPGNCKDYWWTIYDVCKNPFAYLP